MEQNIKIVHSPFTLNLECALNLAININVPYTNNDVNVMINPNRTEYKENAVQSGIQVRHHTEDTKIIHFDFEEDNEHEITYSNRTVIMKLINIGTEKTSEGYFKSFEFYLKDK